MLSEPARRLQYNSKLRGWGVQDVVGNLVGEVLGPRRRQKLKRSGRDVRCDLAVSFKEAALGVTRRVEFSVPVTCDRCSGSGAAPGGTRPCAKCGGGGEAKQRSGLLPRRRPCPYCGGQGVSIVDPCPDCHSVGLEERQREFMVKLPAGVNHGDVKVLAGQGEPGANGGSPGDLNVTVKVIKDPLLIKDGVDVLLDLPLDPATAALGGTVEVPTLRGEVKMKIPPGTQTGRTFRLKGRGIARQQGWGDQLVKVVLETPVDLSPDQRDLLKRFQQGSTEENYPRRRGFKQRAKDGNPGALQPK